MKGAAIGVACLATVAGFVSLPATAQQALSSKDAAHLCAQPISSQRDWLERCVAFDVTGSRATAKILVEPCLDRLGPDFENCLTGRIGAFVKAHPIGGAPVQIAPPTPKPQPTSPATPALATVVAVPADLRALMIAAVVLAFVAGLGLGFAIRRPERRITP